jgi:TRAP-type C4-dicarboxylate transport system permease small subunit
VFTTFLRLFKGAGIIRGDYMAQFVKKTAIAIDRGMIWIEKYFAALVFACLFCLFVVQVVFRYLVTPISWIQDVILVCYLWIIIFGSCCAERSDENVKFSSIYDKAKPKTKIIFDLLSSILVVSALSISFFPSWSYIEFMLSTRASNLPVKLGWIFLPYMYLLTSLIIQYSKQLFRSIRLLAPKGVQK